MHFVLIAVLAELLRWSSALDACSSYSNCPTVVLSGSNSTQCQGEWNLLDKLQWCGRAVYQHKKTGYYLYYNSTTNLWGFGKTKCRDEDLFIRSKLPISSSCGPETLGQSWLELEGQFQFADSSIRLTCRNASATPCPAVRISNLPFYQKGDLEGLYTYTDQYTCDWKSRVYEQYRGIMFLYSTGDFSWNVGLTPCEPVRSARGSFGIYVTDGAEWPEEISAKWMGRSPTTLDFVESNRTDVVECVREHGSGSIIPVDCGEDRFPCVNESKCVYYVWLCDGFDDCRSGQDEDKQKCVFCGVGQFRCLDTAICIPSLQKCDGQQQCPDGSDEWDCFRLVLSGSDRSEVLYILHMDHYYPVCIPLSGWDESINSDLCSQMGYGSVNRSSTMFVNMISSTAFLSSSGSSLNVLLSTITLSSSCQSQRVAVLSCNFDSCGSRGKSYALSSVHQIIKGYDAKPGDWPWQIDIQYSYYDPTYGSYEFLHVCGGTLISPQWVLTAAHCMVDAFNKNRGTIIYRVRLGSVYKSRYDPSAVHVAVQDIIPHPDYNMTRIGSYLHGNDIALLKLNSSVNFTDSIRPICLEGSLNVTYRDCYITGWGIADFKSQLSFDILQENRADVLPAQICRLNKLQQDSMYCVGMKAGWEHTAACQVHCYR